MHILITGGTGFIGQHLLNHLKNKNDQISVLTRNKDTAQSILSSDFNFVTSLNDINFDLIDIVINLAGESIADKKWTKKQKLQICESRWSLTQQLADKINHSTNPPKCFISGSAVGYYGRQDDIRITESYNRFNDEFTHKVCSKWEDIALSTKKNTRVCILRTGIVLSDKQGALNKMLLPFKLGLGSSVANGYQYMSWIHIYDMVNAILFLIHNEKSQGIYNITAPKAVNNKEFSHTLSKTLHRPCLFTMPKTIMKILLGEMSDLIIYGQNVYPEKLIKENFTFKYNTLPDALKNLLVD